MLEEWGSDETVGSSISCNRADAAGQSACLSRNNTELQNGAGGKGPPRDHLVKSLAQSWVRRERAGKGHIHLGFEYLKEGDSKTSPGNLYKLTVIKK